MNRISTVVAVKQVEGHTYAVMFPRDKSFHAIDALLSWVDNPLLDFDMNNFHEFAETISAATESEWVRP